MPSLPDLPTELLMKIIKYYPELYLDIDAAIYGVSSEQFDGNDVLRALSQTSHVLRGTFLPLLWARVHACFTVRNRLKRKIRTRAKMLEGRMIGIRKTSYVVPHIRSLSVMLSECNMGNWQPMAEFIQVLDLLPNFQDLTIVHLSSEMIPVLEVSCRRKVFPSVLRLALNDRLAPIMPCFPYVQALTYQWSTGVGILLLIRDYCHQIHTINNILLSTDVGLRISIPNVKRISLWENITLDTLRLLEGMENLSELQIRHHTQASWPRSPPLDDLISPARRVLATSKATGRKELRIMEFEGTYMHDVFCKERVITSIQRCLAGRLCFLDYNWV
ncbi:hypothetical protein B0H13DRAFT_2045464 [Mycena leptocephala]|nr:hypothetical protein B0H13DRAFT_2045464 [Mycena leptocephala]